MTTPYSNQFRLSITEALSTQLHAALDRLEPAPLTHDNLRALEAQAETLGLPSMSGVYQLYRQEPGRARELTYVGKADQPLPRRLGDHLFKLSGRVGIPIEEISFKCLFVEEDLSSVSPEKMLIKRHLQTGRIVWNNRGFGINDPGRNRDGTVNKSNHFDLEYPIDLSLKASGIKPGRQSLYAVLQAIKSGISFNFRYQRSATFKKRQIDVPTSDMTVDEAFRLVAGHLETGWKISALVGWSIMYKDNDRSYPSAFRYYRPDGISEQIPKTKQPGEDDANDGEEDV
ncbi:GIY-YIG nuclease family protein [Actinomadura alba]|uniref:GIY-YIG nuclease family protein n=1 Tax=Actinomadura alba TaxID=406431 RepID=A0ABR7M2B3_9ACTN|nr:GIY-YIG nuclease family protein [Actinomadura alba]MBC6471176.1 GIY-YIG nuclease family protein [Actinomadura alba]